MLERGLRNELLERALELVGQFEESFGTFPPHPAGAVDPALLEAAWAEFSARMADNYPFFHPRFAGQMLKPPHPVAAAGYLAGLLINPNNHALDGGPVTSEMEKEVTAELAAMFRLPAHLGHLTSSGTIANLEALFVARELAPDKRVLFGTEAHYTHGRMCHLLGLKSTVIGTDARGGIDLSEVEDECAKGDVGTLVLTAGTTGTGAVDPIDKALGLKDRYGIRIHVDAAYGGFFALLAWDEAASALVPAAPLQAIASCDSVVVDPHKHGLQPYGCGAVLFADPSVGRVFKHDSPYTYFTSDDLHLGEISLECSRAGAAAAALWLTLQVLPLRASEGLGSVLAACRRAAVDFSGRLKAGGALRLFLEPELDIVTYFPWQVGMTRAEVSQASRRVLALGMAGPDPVFLSTLAARPAQVSQLWPELPGDPSEPMTLLRSVLMKPEHERWVDELLMAVTALAGESL